MSERPAVPPELLTILRDPKQDLTMPDREFIADRLATPAPAGTGTAEPMTMDEVNIYAAAYHRHLVSALDGTRDEVALRDKYWKAYDVLAERLATLTRQLAEAQQREQALRAALTDALVWTPARHRHRALAALSVPTTPDREG